MSTEMTELVLLEAEQKMAKAVSKTRGDFAGVRTGRAAPGLVEKLMVDYHGTDVPLQQLANTSVPEARMLIVNPYDKATMASIEKAIRNSDLGLNPSNDGQIIRLNFPPLTADRRKDMVKLVVDGRGRAGLGAEPQAVRRRGSRAVREGRRHRPRTSSSGPRRSSTSSPMPRRPRSIRPCGPKSKNCSRTDGPPMRPGGT